MYKLKGYVGNVTFHDGDSQFHIFKINIEEVFEGDVTQLAISPVEKSLLKKGRLQIGVTGNAYERLRKGALIEVEGELVNSKYGLQIRASQMHVKIPENVKGLREYLGSGMIHGIGPHTARDLINHFGEKIVDIIENSPSRLTEAPGVGRKKAQSIALSWKKHKEARLVIEFLANFNINPAVAMKIYKKLGNEAYFVLQNDPYRLMKMADMGFREVDVIAMEMGLGVDSEYRIRAGLEHVILNANRNGSTWVEHDQMMREACGLMGLGWQEVRAELKEMFRDQSIAFEEFDGKKLFTFPEIQKEEKGIAWNVARLMNASFERYPKPSYRDTTLGDKQIASVHSVADNGVSILTGGPGMGKTTVIKTVIDLLISNGIRPEDIVCCAPTGKAAKRMTEATGRDASTIHRKLKAGPDGSFMHDEYSALEGKVFIVDEGSMADSALVGSLIKAIPKGARVMIVGDIDQLPSVGAGSVLKDLIASQRIPVTKLDQVFRVAEGSQISEVAFDMNKGQMPDFDMITQGVAFKETKNDEETRDIILREYKKLIAQGEDPQDILLLSPMKKKENALSTFRLNEMLQQSINPNVGGRSIEVNGRKFYAGDPVINLKNDYDLDILNGDTGVVKMFRRDENDKTVVQIDFEGRLVTLNFDQMKDVDLGYAMTIHKSQGSEGKHVIMPMSNTHRIMLNRPLIYTGATRAKENLLMVGNKLAFKKGIETSVKDSRITGLRYYLEAALPIHEQHLHMESSDQRVESRHVRTDNGLSW